MAKKKSKNKKSDLISLCALWKAKSKSGMHYMTGTTEDGERLVAFFNTKKKNPNEPDIRVYYSNEDNDVDDDDEDDELPF